MGNQAKKKSFGLFSQIWNLDVGTSTAVGAEEMGANVQALLFSPVAEEYCLALAGVPRDGTRKMNQ